jgi:YVTN family beta-propeller protein
LPSHRVSATVPLNYNDAVKPVGVIVSPDGSRIYVANGRANTVSVIDAATLQIVTTVAVGQRVWGIALTPDGKRLYAANGLSNDVSVIDTATNNRVTSVKAGDGPWGVAVRGPR